MKRNAFQIVAILIGIVVLSSGWMRAAQRNEKVVWMYKVVQFNPSANAPIQDAQTLLGEQGAEGWELVSAQEQTRLAGITYFYFKKAR